MKWTDVAEYRSVPVEEEEDMKENGWKSIVHIQFKQYLIYISTDVLNQVCLGSQLSEQVALLYQRY